MGQLGLMAQAINKYGTFAVRAKDKEEAEKLINDELLLENARRYAITLQKVPAKLAREITSKLSISMIGIGTGVFVDGQVLVRQDMLGISQEFSPKFLRRYEKLHLIRTNAVKNYIKDVKSKEFPNENESY